MIVALAIIYCLIGIAIWQFWPFWRDVMTPYGGSTARSDIIGNIGTALCWPLMMPPVILMVVIAWLVERFEKKP